MFKKVAKKADWDDFYCIRCDESFEVGDECFEHPIYEKEVVCECCCDVILSTIDCTQKNNENPDNELIFFDDLDFDAILPSVDCTQKNNENPDIITIITDGPDL